MKKSDREERVRRRNADQSRYRLQEEALAMFVKTCEKAMPTSIFHQWYSEATALAGEQFHIFEYLISGLVQDQTEISSNLRKSIECVLETHGICRSNYQELAKLNYDDYWMREYGYR